MRVQAKSLILLVLICLQQFSAMAQQPVKEEFEFQAEVGRLMDIIINSLYTNKEIFLRELISNASDALDKIRFMSVQDPTVLRENPDLEILVEFDKEAKTVTVTDTGIGMTKNDLIQNLGTIAKSGTTSFIEAIKGGNLNIIGQFGVGFYSAFLVGQKVTVISKHNDDDQYIWESQAANSFTIIKDPEGNTLKRGSKVIIQLKQDAQEYSEEKQLNDLIKKYSEFINFPIKLKVFKEVSKEVELTEEEIAELKEKEAEKRAAEQKGEADDEFEEKEDEKKEDEKKPTKTVKETVAEWKGVNDNKAIWTKPKSEITTEDYQKFYKSLTKDYDDPAQWTHFKAEGEVEFTSLLFIPKRAPHDLFENYYGSSTALRLYVRRVLINEDFEELMPKYFNFIKGVVDSDELPINVSRESIQQLKMLKVMSRKLVRRALEMVKKMSEAEFEDDDDDDDDYEDDDETDETEDKTTEGEEEKIEEEEEEDKEALEKRRIEKRDKYREFWKEFGKNIKLGIIEDTANRQKLAKVSRWYSSKNTTELISFDQYIKNMKTGQENIYFIAGENKDNLMTHPTMQKLLKKGYEVLLLDDPIDEFTFQHLTEFEKKKLVNAGKGDFKFPEDDDNERKKNKQLKKMFKTLTEWWKKLLTADLENVIISQRLVDDPCVIVSSEQGYSANMERISKAQAYSQGEKSNPYVSSKKILEINPSHPAIKELLERVRDDPDQETEELAKVLFEGAMINSGYSIREPNGFSKRFYRLFNGALGIARDAPIEEIEIDLEAEDEEESKDKPQVDKQEDAVNLDDLDQEEDLNKKKPHKDDL